MVLLSSACGASARVAAAAKSVSSRRSTIRSTFIWVYRSSCDNVFFVVSGFLITLISIRRFGSLAQLRPGFFYRIRFARIASPLLLLLAVLSVMHLAGVPEFRIKPQVARATDSVIYEISIIYLRNIPHNSTIRYNIWLRGLSRKYP